MPVRLSASCALTFALILAGLGDAVHHVHEGPIVEPTADCVVDHERHESAEHSTPIDEPHVETEGVEHEHGCVACHGSRIRVALTEGAARALRPEFAARALVDHGNSSVDESRRLPSPRGPPAVDLS